MLCRIPNISVVEYCGGASEVVEANIFLSSEQTHYLGLKAQIVCEDVNGGGWRVTEAAEAAEVEEISIPDPLNQAYQIMEGDGGGGGGGGASQALAPTSDDRNLTRVELYVKI
ncbi:hypothetical protein B0H17DRAFT_1134619 [Mycena rosella]|uniref:Uncharacterized protein n=1 Tax=Mycena rosella TaxID=1033263 RepID=A0AAD7DFK8_MYCRO|nr:hypothetical protein B0H17DRAFT_1134619 [Mycena rosella]